MLITSVLVSQDSNVEVSVGGLLPKTFDSKPFSLFLIEAWVYGFVDLSFDSLCQEIFDLRFFSDSLIKGLRLNLLLILMSALEFCEFLLRLSFR